MQVHSSTKALIFFFAMATLFAGIGFHLGERQGLLWGIVIALSIISLIYFYSDLNILRFLPGRSIEGQDPWGILETTHKIAKRARIPLPNVIISPHPSPQAMALGRSVRSSYIVMTEGLIEKLTPEEREAVIAYLVATIAKRDTLILSATAMLCSFLLGIADFFDRITRAAIGAKKSTTSIESHLISFIFSPLLSFGLNFSVGRRVILPRTLSLPAILQNPEFSPKHYGN